MEVSAVQGNTQAIARATEQQEATHMATRTHTSHNDGDADDGAQRAAMAIATGKGNNINVSV